MDENLVRLILEYGGTGAIIAAVVYIIGRFTNPVFLKWLDNIAAKQEFEAKREENELEQSRRLENVLNTMDGTLNVVNAELSLLRQTNVLLGERINELPTKTDMEKAGRTMREWASKHDNQLEGVHDTVNKITPNVDEQIEKLKTEIERLITDMQQNLTEQLQSESQNSKQACAILEDMQKALQGVAEEIKTIANNVKVKEEE